MSDLLVAVLTGSRPNVFFELGAAFGAGVPSIMVAQSLADLGMLSGEANVIIYGDQPEQIERRVRDWVEHRRAMEGSAK